MAGVVEELFDKVQFDVAKNLIEIGKMTLEEISIACELPLEKVRELAANIPTQPKEPN